MMLQASPIPWWQRLLVHPEDVPEQDTAPIPVIDRREWKYLVNEDGAAELLKALSAFCVPDASGSEGNYRIHSLYFDTPDLRMYRANREQADRRCKLRVRTYITPDGVAAPVVFLEVKRKFGERVVKTRHSLPAERWPHILDEPCNPNDPSGCWAPDGFLHTARAVGAIPMSHVRYDREAWASKVDDYVRVTFDRRLTVAPAQGPAIGIGDPTIEGRMLAYDHAPILNLGDSSPIVVEIKTNHLSPGWVVDLIAHLGLSRRGCSKYCLGLEAMSIIR